MVRQKRIDSYSRDVMVGIIYDVLRMDWPEEFKKHILLKELLWKADAPRGVKGDNSNIIFSVGAKRLWQENEKNGIRPRTGIIIEHAVPRLEIYGSLRARSKMSKAAIGKVLDELLVRVAVTKEENERLDKQRLRQKMPEDWDRLDRFARHKAANIRHVEWQPESYRKLVEEESGC